MVTRPQTDEVPDLKTDLLPIVRLVDAAKDVWLPKLRETGELDLPAYQRMIALRHSLHKATPVHALDALLLLGTIDAVANFTFNCTREGKELPLDECELVREGLAEILVLVRALMGKLEADAGTSLATLGVFQDGAMMQ